MENINSEYQLYLTDRYSEFTSELRQRLGKNTVLKTYEISLTYLQKQDKKWEELGIGMCRVIFHESKEAVNLLKQRIAQQMEELAISINKEGADQLNSELSLLLQNVSELEPVPAFLKEPRNSVEKEQSDGGLSELVEKIKETLFRPIVESPQEKMILKKVVTVQYSTRDDLDHNHTIVF